MKLLITGHGRHGKDSVCDILSDTYGLTFESSSHFLLERWVWLYLLTNYGLSYPNAEACYADRGNHREEWFKAIVAYNTPDLTRLARNLYARHDIYCGMRNIAEFNAVKEAGLFDLAIWVDASKRLPAEPDSSMTITADDCDVVLDNNGTLAQLPRKTIALYEAAELFVEHIKENA